MSWQVTLNGSETTCFCKGGDFYGTSLWVVKQDHFYKNRYCEIKIRGSITTVAYESIRNACDEVKCYQISPGISAERFTFLFHNGKEAKNFKECVDVIAGQGQMSNETKNVFFTHVE